MALTELEKLYSTKEVGALFSVTAETVRNWITKGDIQGIRVNGFWRIPKSQVIKLGNERFGD